MPKAQLHKREFDICLLEYSTRRLCFIGASYRETSNENGDGDGNENFKEGISSMIKTKIFHVQNNFQYISLPPIHGHDAKFFSVEVLWRM